MKKEVTATGIDATAAINSGALLLGVTSDAVQFEIIDLPRKGGFLGLKKLPAKVRVWIEVPDEKKPEAPVRAEKPAAKPAPARTERPAPKAERPARAPRPAEEKPAPKAAAAPKAEAAPEKPAEPIPAPVEIEPTEEVRTKVERAAQYVREILGAMEITEFELTPHYYAENVRLQLSGTGIGSVIGRRGETLDSLQYLASLVANRGEGDYIRLNIDSGNYREKRARTLEALARKLAGHAVRTGKSTTLEPMNPYERRIIHGAVSSIKGATSSSIGVEPNRRVVISAINPPKRPEGARPEGGNRGGNRGGRGGRPAGNRTGAPRTGAPRTGEGRPPRTGEGRPHTGGRPAGRRGEDVPAIGGPVRREMPIAAEPKVEKSDLEKELVSGTKRYGKIDL